jgi:hypothetical protein
MAIDKVALGHGRSVTDWSAERVGVPGRLKLNLWLSIDDAGELVELSLILKVVRYC